MPIDTSFQITIQIDWRNNKFEIVMKSYEELYIDGEDVCKIEEWKLVANFNLIAWNCNDELPFPNRTQNNYLKVFQEFMK